MMFISIGHRRAFTLIELLVSMALIAVVATVATTAFMQMLVMTRRLQSRQTMDATAKTVYEKLNREVTVIHPCTALWLRSEAVAKTVEFVFMHGKLSPYDFPDSKQPWDVGQEQGFTDLLWSRWYWDSGAKILYVSEGRSGRFFRVNGNQTRNYWKIPGGSRMGNYYSTFLSIPQPQHDTGTSLFPDLPEDILNSNAWQSGEPGDIGDYADLLLNAKPLLFNCTDFTCELQNLNGATKTADSIANLKWAVAGSYVDGQTQANLNDRPSLVRIRFTLNDAKTKTSNTYSFSCTTPSATHY